MQHKEKRAGLACPVVFTIFNRPHLTKQSFAQIGQAKPSQLFLIADGPRSNSAQDERKCREVREIVSHIDWNCKVYKKFSDTNLGAARNISQGLNWVFEHVDRAIILEDDCVAEIDFFFFCQDLLARYYSEPKIMCISGNHFLSPEFSLGKSYYYLSWALVWGWATWKRAWAHYPRDLHALLKNTKKDKAAFPGAGVHRFLSKRLKEVRAGRLSSWDYPWAYAVHARAGLCVCPSKNLVANIGFGQDGTHTFGTPKEIYTKSESLSWPMQAPPKIQSDPQMDNYIFRKHILPPLWQRIKDAIAKVILYRYWKARWHACIGKGGGN